MCAKKKTKAKDVTLLEKHADCCYTIHHVGIGNDERIKKRGFIIQDRDEVVTMPFKQGSYTRRKEHYVRQSKNGKLSLTPSRQKVKLSMTFDRMKDSEDEFLRQFLELIRGYEIDIIKYEIEQCLESDT